ncbi:1922_t:CDS:1, partial [Cetraspora pellucida]
SLQDIYHSMGGKARTLLNATFNILNNGGKKAFIEHWKTIKKPSSWGRLPNPIRHHQSFIFSNVLKISMLMPFILRHFLNSNHIKKEISSTKQTKQLCILWAVKAKVLKLAFSTTMTESTYKELQDSLRKEHEMLIQISFIDS